MDEIKKYKKKIFESIKHNDNSNNEYWEARELQEILGYKEQRYFQSVIEKAQISCPKSNNKINDHFGA